MSTSSDFPTHLYFTQYVTVADLDKILWLWLCTLAMFFSGVVGIAAALQPHRRSVIHQAIYKRRSRISKTSSQTFLLICPVCGALCEAKPQFQAVSHSLLAGWRRTAHRQVCLFCFYLKLSLSIFCRGGLGGGTYNKQIRPSGDNTSGRW